MMHTLFSMALGSYLTIGAIAAMLGVLFGNVEGKPLVALAKFLLIVAFWPVAVVVEARS